MMTLGIERRFNKNDSKALLRSKWSMENNLINIIIIRNYIQINYLGTKL